MSSRFQVTIENRRVVVATGEVSQTVNICDATNRIGNYDWTIRLVSSPFVSKQDIECFARINELLEALKQNYQGHIERRPTHPSVEVAKSANALAIASPPLSPQDNIWVAHAQTIVEMVIDGMVREFLAKPYLHRVEHSLHVRLHQLLSVQPHFSGECLLADKRTVTQPIHKEWPETVLRPEKGNRRGNFDLAVLSPELLLTCDTKQFAQGRLAAPIAIEMGLNYGIFHFYNHADKLLNSRVQHGYIVHLTRDVAYDPAIESAIHALTRYSSLKVAFAHVAWCNKFRKLIGESHITQAV